MRSTSISVTVNDFYWSHWETSVRCSKLLLQKRATPRANYIRHQHSFANLNGYSSRCHLNCHHLIVLCKFLVKNAQKIFEITSQHAETSDITSYLQLATREIPKSGRTQLAMSPQLPSPHCFLQIFNKKRPKNIWNHIPTCRNEWHHELLTTRL